MKLLRARWGLVALAAVGCGSAGKSASGGGVCGGSSGVTLLVAPTDNLCTTGTASTVMGTGPWDWRCVGADGGATAQCSAFAPNSPLAGGCGSANETTVTTAPATNLCSAGTPTAITGTGPWTWSCVGAGGGATVECSAYLTGAPVSGACGAANGVGTTSAPTFNLCNPGSASAVTGSGPWAWSCTGANGGTTAACAAPAATIAITPTSLPAGKVGIAYAATLSGAGGVAPYTWSIAAGSLPKGLSIGNSNGAIAGAPFISGTFNFTVQVTDSTPSSPIKVSLPLSIVTTNTAVPADGQALPLTGSVLSYLSNLPKATSKKVLSGQLAAFGNDPQTELMQNWSDISMQTQITPALMHLDYACFNGCDNQVMADAPILQALITHWQAGGLVQLSVHHSNPATGKGGESAFTPAQFTELLTTGSTFNNAYLAELDLIADQLSTLQQAGVVVLYRPFLEMNGTWFWWSMGSATQYVQLWLTEFKYLTQTRHLHNLLFVWAASSGATPDNDPAPYYPGDKFVDVAALDLYKAIDGMPVGIAAGYAELTTTIAPSKPFGFAEYGPLNAGANTTFVQQDYDQLIVGIKKSMPLTTFWCSWESIFSMGLANLDGTPPRHANVAALLRDPWVVNEGDLSF